MPDRLLLTIRFLEDRYHGVPEWPPSPGRVFQALVAGAARGSTLAPEDQEALQWLEGLAAPEIVAPREWRGPPVTVWVPNNDLDAVDGDPARIPDLRVGKTVRPRLLSPGVPLVYLWAINGEATRQSAALSRLCGDLYQLGRGIDSAWAQAELLDAADADHRLATHPGTRHTPTGGVRGTVLPCPMPGTLESLLVRYRERSQRFRAHQVLKPTKRDPKRMVPAGTVFTQPPKARLRQVAYDCPPTRLLFDLRREQGTFSPWPQGSCVALTEHVRDSIAAALAGHIPDATLDAVIKGLGARDADKARRVRIVPLPSIGMGYTHRAIRRVVIMVPQACPIAADDIAWSVAQVTLDKGTVRLVATDDQTMLTHYDPPRRSPLLWQTVTPAALPEAPRRRIAPKDLTSDDPAARRTVPKPGGERADEEGRAAGAVLHALRHAGIDPRLARDIRVQREPWSGRGVRADAVDPGRFCKHALWHVQIRFAAPPLPAGGGPLAIGDGRFVGLGLMAPAETTGAASLRSRRARSGVVLYEPTAHSPAWPPIAQRADLLHHVRRALMALASDTQGRVPPLFSGHLQGAGPARPGHHGHIFLFALDRDGDGRLDRIGVVAPWRADRTAPRTPEDLRLFRTVTEALALVRAGSLGLLDLTESPDAPPELTGPSRVWCSASDYWATRHRAVTGAEAEIATDIVTECARRGLPRPTVTVEDARLSPSGRLSGRATVTFRHRISGPLLLGRTAHAGGGLFLPEPTRPPDPPSDPATVTASASASA